MAVRKTEANQDWITFVDSDEYVAPYFVESIEIARRSDSDLLIWKTKTCYSESADWIEHKTSNMIVSYYLHDSFGLESTGNSVPTWESI